MKKLVSILLMCSLLLALCACAKAAPAVSPEPSVTPEATETPSPSPSAPPELPALTKNGEKLTELLLDLSNDCRPGTAGSSLVAAAIAGGLLDWYAESKAADEEITNAAEQFFASLSSESAELFMQQMELVYYSALDLCAENGEDLLSSCGYEAKSFPWGADMAEKLFTPIYDGLGEKLPE